MRRFTVTAVTAVAVAILTLTGCGSDETAVETGNQDGAPNAPSVAQNDETRRDSATVENARECVASYGTAPALAMSDREPPRSAAAATEGAVGRIDGRLAGLHTRKADPTSLSAEVDGATRTVELENTHLVLVVDVDGVEGDVGSVRPGAQVQVPLAFASGVAGASLDVGAGLAAMQASCPLGMTLRLYPSAVRENDGTSEAIARPAAILLIADDGQFTTLDPLVSSEKPFGLETADEFAG